MAGVSVVCETQLGCSDDRGRDLHRNPPRRPRPAAIHSKAPRICRDPFVRYSASVPRTSMGNVYRADIWRPHVDAYLVSVSRSWVASLSTSPATEDRLAPIVFRRALLPFAGVDWFHFPLPGQSGCWRCSEGCDPLRPEPKRRVGRQYRSLSLLFDHFENPSKPLASRRNVGHLLHPLLAPLRVGKDLTGFAGPPACCLLGAPLETFLEDYV